MTVKVEAAVNILRVFAHAHECDGEEWLTRG